jgi:hypothetical protein
MCFTASAAEIMGVSADLWRMANLFSVCEITADQPIKKDDFYHS